MSFAAPRSWRREALWMLLLSGASAAFGGYFLWHPDPARWKGVALGVGVLLLCTGCVLLRVGVTRPDRALTLGGLGVILPLLVLGVDAVEGIAWTGGKTVTVTVRVADAVTGHPVPNALVEVYRRGNEFGVAAGRTDPQGTVSISPFFSAVGLAALAWVLTEQALGYLKAPSGRERDRRCKRPTAPVPRGEPKPTPKRISLPIVPSPNGSPMGSVPPATAEAGGSPGRVAQEGFTLAAPPQPSLQHTAPTPKKVRTAKRKPAVMVSTARLTGADRVSGEELKRLMRQAGVTIAELADRLDISPHRVREARASGLEGGTVARQWLESVKGAERRQPRNAAPRKGSATLRRARSRG